MLNLGRICGRKILLCFHKRFKAEILPSRFGSAKLEAHFLKIVTLLSRRDTITLNPATHQPAQAADRATSIPGVAESGEYDN